jgi:hypothetical protein
VLDIEFQMLIKQLKVIIYNGPTNALVCNKTLIQMSHTKTCRHASPHNTTCKTNDCMLPHNHTWRLKF